jgi:hypothetical protein
MAAPPESVDLAKAAKLLTDIRAVDGGAAFEGVEAVAADEAFLTRTSALVHEQAQVGQIYVWSILICVHVCLCY